MLKEKIEKSFLRGVQAFVSAHKEDIRLGDDWFKEIEQNIRDAETILLLLSPNSVTRPWVNFEAGGGWLLNKHLVPLCVGPQLPENLPPPFDRKQATNLSTEDGVRRLFVEIARRADMMEPPLDCTDLMEASKAVGLNKTKNSHSDKSKSGEVAKAETRQGDEDNGLPWNVGSAQLFGWRLGDAFPGLRAVQEFTGSLAVDRLMILLRKPLATNCLQPDDTAMEKKPFWWFRGSSSMFIDHFERIGSDRILMAEKEMTVAKIVVVRSFPSDERNFVYVEVTADSPIGVYKYNDAEIDNRLAETLQNGFDYYVSEQYGLWQGRPITSAEYDDSAAMIDGVPTQTRGAKLRTHYLTKYNFMLCGQVHVINQTEFQQDAQLIFDAILRGKESIDRLIEFVKQLPRSMRFPYGL